MDVPNPIPDLGPLPHPCLRHDRRPLHRQSLLHRLARMGGPRPRAVRSGREHAELRVRQAVLSRRRSGRDPAPESYRGAGAPHHRIGLSNSRAALARVPRRRRCRAASHPRHGVHGSERLCQRDPRPAARRKDERSSDPSLRHHSASSGGSGYPSRAHASGSRRMGALAQRHRSKSRKHPDAR